MWRLLNVLIFVLLQFLRLHVPLAARFTFKWFLTSVPYQVGKRHKLLGARVVLKLPYPQVAFEMRGQVALLCKRFLASAANKGFLTSVSARVAS